jgi:hypothetical protein
VVSAVAEAVAAGDLDELLRLVDRLCDGGEWDALLDLRDRCRRAYHESGRQLWPAASHAEYRLALQAPGPAAAAVLVEGAGRFALGPLPEVAASTHAWDDLAGSLAPGPWAGEVAAERVLRGEDLRDDERAVRAGGDLPLVCAPWEPPYLLATYKAYEVELPGPPPRDLVPVALGGDGTRVADPEVEDALRSVVEPWVVASNGSVAVCSVRGRAEDAVAALGHQEVSWLDVPLAEALCRLAWAGASGGAHGRRRGAAAGRFSAWWALAALTGMAAPDDEWPPPADELGEAAASLRWAVWAPPGPRLGWSLHLAVEDPEDGLAWAIAATDRA